MDLTLYKEDIEFVRDTLSTFRSELRFEGSKRVLCEHDYDTIKEIERINEILNMRLKENLHTKK